MENGVRFQAFLCIYRNVPKNQGYYFVWESLLSGRTPSTPNILYIKGQQHTYSNGNSENKAPTNFQNIPSWAAPS